MGLNEAGKEHGYIKISCEDFPHPAQNLKWASDVIDRLVTEANVRVLSLKQCALIVLFVDCWNQDSKDSFKDVPHDTRHLVSKARKAKRGEHRIGRILHRPTIRDFPKSWLPDAKDLAVPEMDEDARISISQ